MVRRASSLALPCVALALGALLAWPVAAGAEPPDGRARAHVKSHTVPELEQAFWVCDYGATTGRIPDYGVCAAVYAELKQRKFGGDFDRLLAWWRQRKPAEHERLARTTGK